MPTPLSVSWEHIFAKGHAPYVEELSEIDGPLLAGALSEVIRRSCSRASFDRAGPGWVRYRNGRSAGSGAVVCPRRIREG